VRGLKIGKKLFFTSSFTCQCNTLPGSDDCSASLDKRSIAISPELIQETTEEIKKVCWVLACFTALKTTRLDMECYQVCDELSLLVVSILLS